MGGDTTNSIKILLVEDNLPFRALLRESLLGRFRSLKIEEAEDEDEALEKVKTFHPQLIFMDIRLRKGNGLNLTKTIKKDHPDIKIIVLTNYDLPEYREAASQAGANDYLSKGSVSMEQIAAVVELMFLHA
ncbi:MAG: response regulator [Thermodesulfobacteriota bacterium]